MQGPSLHRSNVKLFQKRNNTPRNAGAEETIPQEIQGLRPRESKAKLL
jgi:hypothetical protein